MAQSLEALKNSQPTAEGVLRDLGIVSEFVNLDDGQFAEYEVSLRSLFETNPDAVADFAGKLKEIAVRITEMGTGNIQKVVNMNIGRVAGLDVNFGPADFDPDNLKKVTSEGQKALTTLLDQFLAEYQA